jgi:hypothetical protein
LLGLSQAKAQIGSRINMTERIVFMELILT